MNSAVYCFRLLALCLVVAEWSSAAAVQAPPGADVADSQQLLNQLDGLSVDAAQVCVLRDFRIRRDRVTLYFNRGFVGFLGKVAGEVTGAVFSGEGEILLIPPSAVEKQSLARFTDSPVLEERFSSIYLRFTDQTARELLAKARPVDPDDSEQPGDFALRWSELARRLNPAHSVRVLQDLLGSRNDPYFHAEVQGVNLGVFEVTVDQRLPEGVQVAAVRQSHGVDFVDTWCSFKSAAQIRAVAGWTTSAKIRSYRIETYIDPDKSLRGRTEMEVETRFGGDRLLSFELSRQLTVDDVKDDHGRSLVVFQNASTRRTRTVRENDWISIVLAGTHPPGEPFHLTFTYHGNVIADVGNGVLYVGAHGSWYPNLGLSLGASYDLTFEYPDELTLVATGRRVEQSGSKGYKRSHWISDGAFPVAGFNLGAYDSRVHRLGKVTIEVYATREAETALQKRYAVAQSPESVVVERGPEGPVAVGVVPRQAPPLAPAALLEDVTASAACAIEYFQTLFGPFPYPRLAISQIPGDFGQGWPELVYLPTLAFISGSARSQLGVPERAEDIGEQVTVAHEIAHQWWGNLVGWKTYHDQWLSEGFASYAAALEVSRQPGGSRKLRQLLRGYKKDLLSKTADGSTVESGGPIWLGQRLTNSLNPDGYDAIVYKKACWVLHMLRGVLQDPATGSDETFFKMLREFVARYRGEDPSTEDFIQHAGKYMSRSSDLDHNRRLDWFFNEWVYGTGIPEYRLQTVTRPLAAGKFVVEGSIQQSGVSLDFEMPVPVVAIYGKDRKVLLGRVPVSEGSGRFRFTTSTKPGHIAIDEDEILAVTR